MALGARPYRKNFSQLIYLQDYLSNLSIQTKSVPYVTFIQKLAELCYDFTYSYWVPTKSFNDELKISENPENI